MVKMIDSVLFEQEWFMDLDLFHRLLYVYLLTRTTNSGMFDVNCRRMSFDMGRKVTEQDIFCTYGNRIVRVPGHESKGIFPSFISFCWKRGKELDPEKNRVVKGIVSELSRYGLTIQKVEELASHSHVDSIVQSVVQDELPIEEESSSSEKTVDVDAMFEEFWKEYPARRDGREKNLGKYRRIILDSNNPNETHKKIMEGLRGWKSCRKWTKDNHAYVDSMSKFLNNRFWELEPDNAGANNGNNTKCIVRRADNAYSSGGEISSAF